MQDHSSCMIYSQQIRTSANDTDEVSRNDKVFSISTHITNIGQQCEFDKHKSEGRPGGQTFWRILALQWCRSQAVEQAVSPRMATARAPVTIAKIAVVSDSRSKMNRHNYGDNISRQTNFWLRRCVPRIGQVISRNHRRHVIYTARCYLISQIYYFIWNVFEMENVVESKSLCKYSSVE